MIFCDSYVLGGRIVEKTLRLLGEKIKFLRKEQNLTQAILSNGICTQSYLSNIEKGQTSPSAYVLDELARRLGVDLSFLLKTDEKELYIQEMLEQVREAVARREYKLIEEILENEKTNFFKNKPLTQFYYWHKGIVVFYNEGNISDSIKNIDYAIELEDDSEFFSRTKLEIMISKANILMDSKMYSKAEIIYQNIYEKLTNYHERGMEKLYIRTCYNYSRILRLTQNYEKAIKICERGISACFKFDLMYALGDLYFQKGLVLRLKGRIILARKAYNKALLVFKLYKREDYIELVRKELDKLENH